MKLTELSDDSICRLAIAIEGPDRVGKATQSVMLVERLRQVKGWERSGLIEVPIKDTLTHTQIYAMLHNGMALKYPQAFQALQVTNRLYAQAGWLTTLVSEYDCLVFDRWNASAYAYGRAAGVDIDEIECLTSLVAVPDLTIILDGPGFSMEKAPDDYESNPKLQTDVRAYYLEWAKRQKSKNSIYVVDAADDLNAVHEAIFYIVQQFIERQDLAALPDNVVDFASWKKNKKK